MANLPPFSPPSWARWLLKRLAAYDQLNGSMGDFEEIYHNTASRVGVSAANRWYISELLATLPEYLLQSLLWRIQMFRNIIKTAWRVLKKERLFAAINIFGLAIGLTASLLIFLWVHHELSYERHHAHADSIYRVITVKDAVQNVRVPVTPSALAPQLVSDYAEVAAACRVRQTPQSLQRLDEKTSQMRVQVAFSERALFDCFTHPLVEGRMDAGWDQTPSIILTVNTARRFFGDASAVGEMLELQGQRLSVAAVVENAAGPSHLNFEAVVPLAVLERIDHRYDGESWAGLTLWTYGRLHEGTNADGFEAKTQTLIQAHRPESEYVLQLQPLRDIHLRALEGSDPISTIRLYAGLALFILIVAAINFINLSTARSSRRCLEVGLRKTLGARQSELMMQFQGEALLQTGIAFGLALLLSALLLPEFNALTGTPLKLDVLVSGGRWIMVAALPFVLGGLAGLYPAMVLSAFKPRQVMHKGGGHQFSHHFRQGLVILQFVLSLILFIGALGVARQLQYLQNKPLGFDATRLYYTEMQPMAPEGFEALRAALTAHPAIVSVTRTNMPLLDLGFETDHVFWEGQQPGEKVNVQIRTADAAYLNTLKMTLSQGRFFEAERGVDQGQSCVLNESAVRTMGLDDPVGKWFSFGEEQIRIIGVVRDFHHHSMHTAIEPLVFVHWPLYSRTLFLRINPGQREAAMAHLRSVWPRIRPDAPFQVRSFTAALDALYRNERHTATLVWWLGGLAVLVACLGLVGLTTYTVETVRKEIGIRKVMGATARGIVAQITGKYVRWVMLSIGISWPLSYLMLHGWLQGFAYRTPLSWDLFLSGGATILVLAALTVSALVLRAALVPPVKTLRCE